MATSVYVASGHGADDPGAVANGLKERDVNQAIATRLVKRLRDHKLKVHTDLERGNLRASGEIADARRRGDVALFLALHHNAAAASARGFEVFGTGKTRSRRFAQALHDEVLAELRKLDHTCKDRGVKEAKGTRAESLVVKSPGASALVEFLFLTNKLDAKIAKDKRYAARMAEALCRATIATLRREKLATVTYRPPATKPPPATTKPPAPKPERFVVRHGSGAAHGTFTDEKVALERWRRLRRAGKGGSITAER